MKTSVKEELAGHLLDRISDGIIRDDNREDWHFHAFNEDYYLIGYYQCSEWLKRHEIDPFEAIGICQDYEQEMFGELSGKYDNSERTVNMLTYIYGEELLNDIDANNVKELRQALNEIIG